MIEQLDFKLFYSPRLLMFKIVKYYLVQVLTKRKFLVSNRNMGLCLCHGWCGQDRTSSVPSSVLCLKVDKGQGLLSGLSKLLGRQMWQIHRLYNYCP